jgi:hypothetical protein
MFELGITTDGFRAFRKIGSVVDLAGNLNVFDEMDQWEQRQVNKKRFVAC